MNFNEDGHLDVSAPSGPRPPRQFHDRDSGIPSPNSRRTSRLNADASQANLQGPQNNFMLSQSNRGDRSSGSVSPNTPDDPTDSEPWSRNLPRGRSLYGPNSNQSHASSALSMRSESMLLPPGARQRDSWSSLRSDSRRDSKRGYMEDFTDCDPDLEEELHNIDDDDDDDVILKNGLMKRASKTTCGFFSVRGILNLGALVLLTAGLVTVFAVLPILTYYHSHVLSNRLATNSGGFNLGGINGTGQVPIINSLPGLIDSTTPTEAMTRQGFDGKEYNLVFSDEFSVDGRTFWPGDDPYWEAVDLHYWATGDLEWYDPDAITTAGGNLQITITKEDIHDLDFRSGMLQSWNKFCFTGGYIEVSLSLPGSPTIPGFWPGAWTMGNLGRAGYGATTDGTWPYSYQACDVGTLKNQTTVDGTGPAAALTSGSGATGVLSFLPGQKLSACTCAKEDHPGPNVKVGRGSPEIDLIEAQVTTPKGATAIGQASQSAQFAPFDDAYNWKIAGANIFDATASTANSYKGGIYQESVSVVTTTDQTAYQATGGNFQKFGFEYTPGNSGSITWSASSAATWTLSSSAVGPNKVTQISQRSISQEPMYIILNLAISAAFETVDLAHMVTPNRMLVDYVRVYQSKGQENIGCSPSSYPTEDYIQDHLNAYSNPNLTTWKQAGYNFPKNSLQDTC